MFIVGGLALARIQPDKPYKHSSEIQTITISSTTSVLPIRRLGEKKPKAFTRGARTFAGSMIFTVIDQDPFMELFAVSYDNSDDGSWHIDEMPPFDILIQAVNESGRSGMQLISGVTLTNYGTTYSVDDIYTESSYSYVAEHVSPFMQNTFYSEFLKAQRSIVTASIKTPDDIDDAPAGLPNLEQQFAHFIGSKDAGTVFTTGTQPVGKFGYEGYFIDPVLKSLHGFS